MKKTVALILTVVLLLTITATCLAAHTHAYHQVSSSYESLSDGQRWVVAGACSNLPYSGHYHFYSRYRTTTVYLCSCGAVKTVRSGVQNGPERCPMAKK